MTPANQLVLSDVTGPGKLALASASDAAVMWQTSVGDRLAVLSWDATVVDAQSNLILGGSFYDTVALNGVTLTGRNLTEGFVQKLGLDRSVQWTFRSSDLDPESRAYFSDLAVAPNGNISVLLESRGQDTATTFLLGLAP